MVQSHFITPLVLVIITTSTIPVHGKPQVLGLRLKNVDSMSMYTEDGQISLESGKSVTLGVIGVELNNDSIVKLITQKMTFGFRKVSVSCIKIYMFPGSIFGSTNQWTIALL